MVALKGLVLKATQSLIAVRDVHEHGFDGNGSVKPSMHKQEGGTLDETALVVDGRQKILMGPLNLYNEYVAVDRTRKLAGFIALHEKKKSITRIVALMWWRALRLDNVPTLSAFSIPIAKRRVWESGS